MYVLLSGVVVVVVMTSSGVMYIKMCVAGVCNNTLLCVLSVLIIYVVCVFK